MAALAVSVFGFLGQTQPVYVGLKLNNIESISVADGTFDADFYLQFQSSGLNSAGGCTCPYPLGREFCSESCRFCDGSPATSSTNAEDQCLVPPL